MNRSSKRSAARPRQPTYRNHAAPDAGGGWEPESGVPRYITFPEHEGGGSGPSLASMAVGLVVMVATWFVAESALASKPHPVHWLVAVAGGLVGGIAPMVALKMFARSR